MQASLSSGWPTLLRRLDLEEATAYRERAS